MAIFLTADQLYRLWQRELPEGVYPDGAPSGFFSTASIYAKAQVFETLYENLQVIYTNIFPQTADEKMPDWQIKAFGYYLDASLTLAQQQAAVVNKLRQRPGINPPSIRDIVVTQIGADKTFTLVEWNCEGDSLNGTGVWQLGDSQLGIDTFLGLANMAGITPSLFPTANFCINDPLFGISDDTWAAMQTQAYTYEVRIYGYTLTADQRTALDAALTRGEPARSTHVITDGLDPADLPGGDT